MINQKFPHRVPKVYNLIVTSSILIIQVKCTCFVSKINIIFLVLDSTFPLEDHEKIHLTESAKKLSSMMLSLPDDIIKPVGCRRFQSYVKGTGLRCATSLQPLFMNTNAWPIYSRSLLVESTKRRYFFMWKFTLR